MWLENGLIAGIGDNPPEAFSDGVLETDASGCYVTPGLIDLQVNGSRDCNLWELEGKDSLDSLTREMLSHGVTTFLPTLITDSISNLVKTRNMLESYGIGSSSQWSEDHKTARAPGIHLEGPFLSPERPGVHPKEFIVEPSIESLNNLVSDSILLITMACESEGFESARQLLMDKGIIISIGHSNANFEQANLAFASGIGLVTHIFNAMTGIHHRDPGLSGAALLNGQVSCCLIPDGLHVSPDTVEMILRLKGIEKTILVTDIAHIGTSAGGLVGSSITLDEGVRNLVDWGKTEFWQAITMASLNPARAIGIDEKVGQIKTGLIADLVLWDRNSLEINEVLLGGASTKDFI